MEFVDLAALTVHGVKNRLAILAARAEARGDRETLRDALEAAATLSRLLACYKAEKGQLTADIEACTPADLVAELVAEVRQQTALTISAELERAPELWFYDEHLIRMVIRDAIYNALRYARREVIIAARTRAGWLDLGVRDDGPGYPPQILARAAGSWPLSREGTGLGLYLADRVAALHCNGERHGRVELANSGGAAFHLLLPE